MQFDWRDFTEQDYERYIQNHSCYDNYIGAVHVGDICIDLLINSDDFLSYDFYVAHEDTGYGYKDNGLSYDFADGSEMNMPYDLSYDEFKDKAEGIFVTYIKSYKGNYSLVEHANRPLEIW